MELPQINSFLYLLLTCIDGIKSESVVIACKPIPRFCIDGSRYGKPVELLKHADGIFRFGIVYAGNIRL